MRIPLIACLGLLTWALTCVPATADIVTTGFFTGEVYRYDEQSGTRTTLATIASVSDPFPGLSGIAVSSQNVIAVSAHESNRIYRVDANSGAILGFTQLADGSLPAGLAFDQSGNLYVAHNSGGTVSIFDSNFAFTSTITVPAVPALSGVAFDGSSNSLVISSFGAGIFRYDLGTSAITNLNPAPTANGMVTVDGSGAIYAGSVQFGSDVYKFDSLGAGGVLTTVALPVPASPFVSPDVTSPVGVAIDADGNLIVAAMGRTNPFSPDDNFQNDGALLKYSSTGDLLQTFGTGLTPYSSVAIITVPEPSGMGPIIAAVLALGGMARRRRS